MFLSDKNNVFPEMNLNSPSQNCFRHSIATGSATVLHTVEGPYCICSSFLSSVVEWEGSRHHSEMHSLSPSICGQHRGIVGMLFNDKRGLVLSL